MRGKVFLDTNVLVYLYDEDSPGKQARSRALLEEFGTPRVAISTQVLQEFYVTVTRKFGRRLLGEQIVTAARSLSQLPIVQVSTPLIFEAISLARRFQLSLWDTLIIRAALEAKCQTLFTEDLQHGQLIGDPRNENPYL